MLFSKNVYHFKKKYLSKNNRSPCCINNADSPSVSGQQAKSKYLMSSATVFFLYFFNLMFISSWISEQDDRRDIKPACTHLCPSLPWEQRIPKWWIHFLGMFTSGGLGIYGHLCG